MATIVNGAAASAPIRARPPLLRRRSTAASATTRWPTPTPPTASPAASLDGNARLRGDSEANLLSGGNGDDAVDGGTGADSVRGGGGADLALGDAQNEPVR